MKAVIWSHAETRYTNLDWQMSNKICSLLINKFTHYRLELTDRKSRRELRGLLWPHFGRWRRRHCRGSVMAGRHGRTRRTRSTTDNASILEVLLIAPLRPRQFRARNSTWRWDLQSVLGDGSNRHDGTDEKKIEGFIQNLLNRLHAHSRHHTRMLAFD